MSISQSAISNNDFSSDFPFVISKLKCLQSALMLGGEDICLDKETMEGFERILADVIDDLKIICDTEYPGNKPEYGKKDSDD